MVSFRITGKKPVLKTHFLKSLTRLRSKTSIRLTRHHCLQSFDDWASQEKVGAKRQVYLVTPPHPRQTHSRCGKRLVAPGSKTKDQILECFLDAAAHPSYTDGRSLSRGRGASLERALVAREYGQVGGDIAAHPHDHIPVLASTGASFRYAPVKKALLDRHGLASHWSCTHLGYWSAVRYVYVPSPKKPRVALDACPVLWAADGAHPLLHECCHEPLTAAALESRSEEKQRNAAEEGKHERVTELDVFPLVVKNGFRPGQDADDADLKLIEFAKSSCSSAMQAFLFKLDRRDQLKSLINTIWKWEGVNETLAVGSMSRLDFLHAAAKSQCVCGKEWATHVTASFLANGISPADVCTDVYNALKDGRRETSPVIVMAGARGGEGKSLFLKALLAVYGDGNVFHAPEAGRFPLLDLVGKKVVFLDDWRFDDNVLAYATQCRWYDGSVVQVSQPQNRQGVSGHFTYKGEAPIFATTKLDDMERLERLGTDDPVTGKPADVNASMCFRRLKVYAFRTRIAMPGTYIKYCRRCFADLVFNQARRS